MEKIFDRKFYLILSKDRKYTQGAFPFSPEGLKLAKKFVKDKNKTEKDKFYIVEK